MEETDNKPKETIYNPLHKASARPQCIYDPSNAEIMYHCRVSI